MTQDEFDTLDIGDIVRGKASGDGFVVVGHAHTVKQRYVIAVREVTMTQPHEWDLVKKSGQKSLQEATNDNA